jgi:Arc/MetJ-type ribon-helix-helix transcriptional regulator
MSKAMKVNVRVTGTLGDFVAENIGEYGSYENVSDYVLDLIRRDKDRVDRQAFNRLKAQLVDAFAAPDDAYDALTAHGVIERNSPPAEA